MPKQTLIDLTNDVTRLLVAGGQQAPGDDGLRRRGPQVGSDRDDPAPALLGRILHWTDGHPYLTQRLCRAVAEANWTLRDRKIQPVNSSAIDGLCEELFLCSRARESDTNLVFLRERMLRSHAHPLSLLQRYSEVVCGKPVADDLKNPLAELLRLAGITKGVNGFLQVRRYGDVSLVGRCWRRELIARHPVMRTARAVLSGPKT